MGSVGDEDNGSAGSVRNKNRAVESEVNNDDFDDDPTGCQQPLEIRRKSNRRFYVFACAVLASLNTVLLGYGNKLKSQLMGYQYISIELLIVSVSLLIIIQNKICNVLV
ncbi:hypothetical protein BT93_D1221 [Corymbia citriodora subsp. variegata]|nr:hypothetical protein BT93_D1221 [Corymbia citriodora subsp. variegata]